MIPTERKSTAMAAVRTKRTNPELLVRRVLRRLNVRFRGNVRSLPGSPDLVLLADKTVILIHGCFWHHHEKCGKGTIPRTNPCFWQSKIGANVKRDRRNGRLLKQAGWRIITIWECETSNIIGLSRQLETTLGADTVTGSSAD